MKSRAMPMINFVNKSQIQTQDNCLLEQYVNPTINKYYSGLLNPLHAALSVFATLSLKNRTKPLSVIFEASSGLGKTAVLQMTFPVKESPTKISKSADYVYRSDKFTPRSFVSHAANVKKAELKDIDLLPRLKNKVLVTKELAPIFRGRENELQENFSILISVLDGKGYTSDSGTMGQRGYQESIIFNWLGATTPLPITTHRIMSQLGTRLLFYEVLSAEPTLEDLYAYAEMDNSGKAEVECNVVVNNFLIEFFKRNPVGSIDSNSIIISSDLSQQIVKWAKFLVKGRAEVKYDKDYAEWEPIAALPSEGPYKVIDYFKELARGHTLIHDRKEVNSSDIEFVSHIAISSIPIQLRPIIRELRISEYVDSGRCEKICLVSRPTARKYLKELNVLGIVNLTEGSKETNEGVKVTLADEFLWLRKTNNV
jgi:hypothetical protein